jgi:hypothetical protein
MHLTNFHFYNQKNYLYSKPVKGFRGCGVSYRFAFNGQEKDDEVSGAGNTMTAEFWEYDSRLGRRWNVDPIINPFESGYATFSNSPTSKIDPKGDYPLFLIGWFVGASKEIVSQTIANGIKNKNNGKSFWSDWNKQMDWADVVITSGEYAVDFGTLGLSVILTTTTSDALKSAVDVYGDGNYKYAGARYIEGNDNHHKTAGTILKDFAANTAGSYTGIIMGTNVLGDGLADVVFGNIAKHGGRWAGSLFSGSIQGTLEGIWQTGYNALSDEIYDNLSDKYKEHQNKNNSILLKTVTVKGKKNKPETYKLNESYEEILNDMTTKYNPNYEELYLR